MNGQGSAKHGSPWCHDTGGGFGTGLGSTAVDSVLKDDDRFRITNGTGSGDGQEVTVWGGLSWFDPNCSPRKGGEGR